jgi:hypothetical protein
MGGVVARGSSGTRTALLNITTSGKIQKLLDSTNPSNASLLEGF